MQLEQITCLAKVLSFSCARLSPADAGAVKPLVSLLSTKLSDDGGRQVAAAAIENLTYDNTAIRKSVVDAGGVPMLVSLLESNSEAAQKSAAGALHNLALARANCVKIAAAGGIEPLVGLLETGPEAVQAVAGGTIGKLALDPDNRAEIVEAREKLLDSDSKSQSSNDSSSSVRSP
jgi:vacuolar protein 8